MKDIGKETAAKSPGLLELAASTEKNSERNMRAITSKRYLLSLPIPLSKLERTLGTRYSGDFNAISLRSWLTFLVNYNCWHVLTGLARPDPPREKDILRTFWERYRKWRPQHQLWDIVDSKGIDLSRVAPVVIHGDEGRGFKKSAFLVMAYHSYLGLGTTLANQVRKRRPYVCMKLNYSGNAWSHRFITAVLPKMMKDEQAFQTILRFITDDCLDVLHNGVEDASGNKYYAAVLQCVGDWQFLVKAGGLVRSYSNVEKRPRAEASCPRGICHYCKAGQINVPFEDFRSTAVWRTTQFRPDDSPFSSMPVLLALPHEATKPARFFCFDLWHSMHLGMGKTFLGSVLALMSDCMDGGSIDVRFQNLTHLFQQWAADTKTTPYISIISKDSIQWQDRKSYPNGNWSKGHVTTTLMKFVTWYLERTNHDDNILLVKSREAATMINEALTSLYASDVWLTKADAREIGRKAMRYMQLYMEMASIAYHSNQSLFVFMPKAHACDHVFSELAMCESAFCLNPLCHAVQVDEDMIGKVSRVSRRVSPLQVIKRVLERALHASFAHFVTCGYIISH